MEELIELLKGFNEECRIYYTTIYKPVVFRVCPDNSLKRIK